MLASMMQVSRREKYERMREMLNEKQWRHYLALEAQERGSVAQIAQEARVSHNTVRRGIREVEAGERYSPGDRQRQVGDPMSLLKWTATSVAHLEEALERMGHEVAQTTIRRMLRGRGYSLRANKKNSEGTSHPDRDAQLHPP